MNDYETDKIALLKAYDKIFETIFTNYCVTRDEETFRRNYVNLKDTFNKAAIIMNVNEPPM